MTHALRSDEVDCGKSLSPQAKRFIELMQPDYFQQDGPGVDTDTDTAPESVFVAVPDNE